MSNTAEIINFSAAQERRSNRMENQKTGYIPLYRSILKQPWAKDVYLRTLWENLLLNAARKPYTANFKGHVWNLVPGQLVTTSADLGLALCDRSGEPTSRHAVERMLAVFEKEGMISVRAERRKGTLISILNYAEYAQKSGDLPAHNSEHMTAHNEASNDKASEHSAAHNSAHTTAHHEQEGLNKNIKTPLTPQGESSLAQEVLDYYNLLTGSRCSSTSAFEKALSTVKAKGECFTAEDIKLVIRWAHAVWGHSFKPENLCRMTRFDGYLSDALIWADGMGSNPAPCPHNEIIELWNKKFPGKAVQAHEWNRRRPAYRDLEAVWNGKTSQGNWRELKHMGMAFDLIGKSSLFTNKQSEPWLTLDWILNPKNWGSVYEQAINEHRQRKGVPA